MILSFNGLSGAENAVLALNINGKIVDNSTKDMVQYIQMNLNDLFNFDAPNLVLCLDKKRLIILYIIIIYV